MVFHLLEPCHPTGLTLNVLDQPRYQLVLLFALRALEFIRVVGWRIEVSVQRDKGTEFAVAEIALVRGSVECLLSGRVVDCGDIIGGRDTGSALQAMGYRDSGDDLERMNSSRDLVAMDVVAGA